MRLVTVVLFLTTHTVSAGYAAAAQIRLPAQLTTPALPWGLAPDAAVCPLKATRGNQTASAGPPPLPPTWVRGHTCYLRQGVEFCAYVDPTFNGGQGVALLTSEERLRKIISQDSFKAASDASTTQGAAGRRVPYRDVEVPGKGLGLVATEPIRDLSLIMSHTPAVMADGKAIDALNVKDFAELTCQGIELLPEHHRAQYLNLSTHDVPVNYTMKVYQIFARNAFRTSVGDGGTPLHSVFTEASRMNHDCIANLGYYFDEATLRHKVYAVRDIMPGEELSVGYIDPYQSRDARQANLLRNWGFKCTCKRCTAEDHVVQESDDRVKQIRTLIAELDEYGKTGTGTPDKAELLITLQELEGQFIRMYEAYYRAAVEWNGVGETTKAVRYARLCLARGIVLRGPGRAFAENLRALMKEPEKHWTYRFRLKHAEGQTEPASA